MFNKSATTVTTEPLASEHHHHLLCWKSVFAGLVIALMAFVTLSALGAGIAGMTAESLINKEAGGGSALATAGGLWVGLSILISLFCGSYFAVRVSRFLTTRVGAAHGFVVASLFFGFLLMGVGNMVGGLAQGFGSLARNASEGASALSSSPIVQDSIDKALGNSTLKSDPKTVATGLGMRLLQGDTESAKSYFAYQTGMSTADVDAKFAQMQNDFNAAMKTAGEKSARAVGDAGLSLFVVFIVGLLGALIGGRVGAQSNVGRPFARMESAPRMGMPQPRPI